jgi:glycosyltransferase involved in cell wall biosynthesis
MRIGLVTNSIDEQSGGVATYASELIRNLNAIDEENDYILIHHTPSDHSIYHRNQDIIIKSYSPYYKGTIWKLVNAPLKLRKGCNLDVVHDLNGIGPLSYRMPFQKVVTIHDLIPIIYPTTFNLPNALTHRLLLPKTLHRADKIITVSSNTKKDIMNIYDIPEEKITTIYNAVSEHFKIATEQEILDLREKYSLNFPFILFVGTLEPRKNIPSLLKAFKILSRKEPGLKLVIAGKRGWKYKEIFQLISSLEIGSDVRYLQYIDQNDLPVLYSAAEVFVYPSLYEGFGLPPLEAMACGCPVVTSNVSSMPEVTGNAALLIDPTDVEAISDSVHLLLSDDNLKGKMIKNGLTNVKRFSWHQCAKETRAVYEELWSDSHIYA